MNAEVGERDEAVLIDGIPKAQFGRDSAIEPIENWQAVASLGRRCQPQKFRWTHVTE